MMNFNVKLVYFILLNENFNVFFKNTISKEKNDKIEFSKGLIKNTIDCKKYVFQKWYKSGMVPMSCVFKDNESKDFEAAK